MFLVFISFSPRFSLLLVPASLVMQQCGDGQAAVQSFYAGRAAFVTGGTGFVGKVLIEKLLRSTEISRIYVLMRRASFCTAQARWEHVVSSKLFDVLREERAEALAKVIPVDGDLTHENMGVSEDVRQQLYGEVSLVFHCAAVIKFDEDIRTATQLNVVATQRVLQLAGSLRELVALVHTSTAYAHCQNTTVTERIPAMDVTARQLIDALSWLPSDAIDRVTKQIIGDRPNTYTFTKALAETMIATEAAHLPAVIVRPSIVGASLREPVVGWVDNLNGASGLFAAVGNGVLHLMYGDSDALADIIPVDVVVNTLLCAGYFVASRADVFCVEEGQPPVVNCCTGSLNGNTWYNVVDMMKRTYAAYPMDMAFRPVTARFTLSWFYRDLMMCLDHWFPAYATDAVLHLQGKKSRMVKLTGRVIRAVSTLEYFTGRSWNFESRNILQMWHHLHEQDRDVFPFDVRELNWRYYLEMYYIGVKKYTLHQDMSKISHARQRYKKLQLWSQLARGLSAAIAFHLLYRKRRSNFLKRLLATIWLVISYTWKALTYAVPALPN